MEFTALVLFMPICFALNMSPGPNNLMSLNNARCYGLKTAILAGIGRIAAFIIMLILAASGLAVVLYTSEVLFFLVKLFGAVYLLWLAYNLWRSDVKPTFISNQGKGNVTLIKQEFFLAAGNPKAILIFTAFLPQFIDVSNNVNEQFFTLGVTFLCLELLAISIYALLGCYLSQWFEQPSSKKRFNQVCAGFLALSGANLLFGRQ